MTYVRTYAEDLVMSGNIALCAGVGIPAPRASAAEVIRKVRATWLADRRDFADERDVTHVHVTHVPLDRGGYTRSGRYYGYIADQRLFDVELAINGRAIYATVRTMSSRAALRAELKKVFRHATVSR